MGALSVSVLFLCLVCADGARVQTNLGELEGSSFMTQSGKEVFTFLGVPFAKSSAGKNKFKEPKPAKRWSGVWLATDHGPACIQFDGFSDTPDHISGSEDCLYLNVYTTSISNSSNFPVLVFFHGGSFSFGDSSNFDPKYLLENHDIVYVSANYRLGPFGFLSTQDSVVPGNNGLKDQVLALRWVQQNIASFGGNKSQVTIAGNSAGGASVHYHYLSPVSQGLFQRGISSSGSALTPWALTEEPLQKATMLADSVGCPTNNTSLMMKCLKIRPSRQILSNAQSLFMPWQFNPFTPFGPVVENTTKYAFMGTHPYQLLKQGKVNNGSWLVGVTTEEGLYPGASFIDREELLQALNDSWSTIAPHLLDFNFTATNDKHGNISDEIRSFYFESDDISEETKEKIIEMLGDRMFKADMGLAARLQAAVSPVYFYMFGYRGNNTLANHFTKTQSDLGVSHFDDMFYTLKIDENALMEDESYNETVVAMTRMWASFIVTGRPTPSETVQWDPVPQDSAMTGNFTYLLINSYDDMEMMTDDDFGNYKFWNSLGLTENIDNNSTLKM